MEIKKESDSLIKIYDYASVSPLINKRPGETKFGEAICFIEDLTELQSHKAKYVILGIPEDIGVRANYGKPGTSKAFYKALGAFLNIQCTTLTPPNKCILLGEIDCDQQMQQAETILLDEPHAVEELGQLVRQIDDKVSLTIEAVVAAGKIPIIIGGGHNNSYGNLKGTARGLQKKVNCINFDAHSDFRTLEHRHSGNGFSYAFEEGFLGKYFIFGLHQNYTSQEVFESLAQYSDRLRFNFYEDIAITKEIAFSNALLDAEEFITTTSFGIEIDLDAIEYMGSSAMTPSGFSLAKTRQFLRQFAKNQNCKYIHLCEGAPDSEIFPNQVGKAIAYLLSDIIH